MPGPTDDVFDYVNIEKPEFHSTDKELEGLVEKLRNVPIPVPLQSIRLDIPVDEGNKFDQGKLRYGLIPPEALKELAKAFTIGAKNHGADNWKKLSRDRVIDALMRHCEEWRSGRVFDYEEGCKDHHVLGHMMACASMLIWFDLVQDGKKPEEA